MAAGQMTQFIHYRAKTFALVQMAISKRSLSLGRGYDGQGTQAAANKTRHSPVAQWRVEHGLPEMSDADHTCSGRCLFVNIIDNVYICEQCGCEHVCDESCKERVLDTANGMPVCPISGMCFDQLDAGWEVRQFRQRLQSQSLCLFACHHFSLPVTYPLAAFNCQIVLWSTQHNLAMLCTPQVLLVQSL